MKKPPTVSVFVPYYNDRNFLPQCIESILAQTFKDFELVLLNHATTDDCRRIAHSFDDPRIVHIDMPSNLGAGSGMLILEFLKVASGKFAKLFCADDLMRPDCLEKLVGYMLKHPETDVAFGDMEYVDAKGDSLGTRWSLRRPHFEFGKAPEDSLHLLFDSISFLPYPCSIAKTDVLRKAEIDKSMIMLLDVSLWANLIIDGAKIDLIPELIVNYRIHGKQTSAVKNESLSARRYYFEALKYYDIFYRIRSVKLIKAICPESPFAGKLNAEEKRPEIFKFIIAHHCLKSPNKACAANGYAHMHDLMQDDNARKSISGEFNFGIREFREIYSNSVLFPNSPKQVGFWELLYLLLRRLWIIVTFKEVKRKWRRRKMLSL